MAVGPNPWIMSKAGFLTDLDLGPQKWIVVFSSMEIDWGERPEEVKQRRR